MTVYDYARVSTEGQDLAPQLAALQAAGCAEIVEEKASGTDRARPGGDTLVVVRIDRLARSVVAAVNAALPAGRRRFTRDRLVRCMRLLVEEGLAERQLLEVAGPRPRRRKPEAVRAAEAVARYLRGHRCEAIERGVPAETYRPPTLAQIGKHLAEDARIEPTSGGAWAPSSLKALIDRARSSGQV